MSRPPTVLSRLRSRGPITLLFAFVTALILSAWAVPIVYDRYQIAGLHSDELDRRETALNHIIAHAATSERVEKLAIETIGRLDADTAGKAYMALRRVNAHRAPGVRVNLFEAYRDADHEAFTNLIRVLIADRAASVPAVTEAILSRLDDVNDERFDDLAGLLKETGAWRHDQVPLAIWLRWTGRRLASPLPAIRIAATTELFNSAAMNDAMSKAQASEALRTGGLTEQLLSAVDDPDPRVRRGGAYATLAWKQATETRALELANAWPTAQARLLLGINQDWKDIKTFRDVVPPEANRPAPLSENTREGDGEPAAVRLLWLLESQRQRGASIPSSIETPHDDWPPLQRALAATTDPENNADILRQLLADDSPWLRAITAVLLAECGEDEITQSIAIGLARSVDPIERQSAALLGLLLTNPKFHSALTDFAARASGSIRSMLVHEMGDDPSPQVTFLYDLTRLPSIGGADPWHHDYFAGLLSHDELPYPIVLTGLLTKQHRAGWDHMLGPFGLSDDALIVLLDHHRFAWVLDALMPEDAPRFPLWLDRTAQLRAIAALRVWWARNRATWTHG
ncbi:MAG: hypothetical protein AAF328_05490 [Planctomycetota bacterium]